MDMIQYGDLGRFCTGATPFLVGLNKACAKAEITTNRRLAYFLAQFAEETKGFSKLHEIFDYTPQALMATFRGRITAADACALGRQAGESFVSADRQAAIANIVYANRNGNGDISSGDGSRYRGRGPGITFKDNYQACGTFLGLDLVNRPDMLEDPYYASQAGAWYWGSRNINATADAGDFLGVCRLWNVGTLDTDITPNGYADRQVWLAKAQAIWPEEAT